ncbi:hypothetical protein [Cellulomonas sp. URHB0016]
MNDHLRGSGGPARDRVPDGEDPELVERIARALRSRDAAQPDPADIAARLEARLALLPPAPVTTLARRGTYVVAAGVVTGALAVAGAGAAAAANPYSPVARTVENVAHAVGIDWSAMPDGYTREQYEAFWASCTVEDMQALSALWGTEPTETKARAGQLLLDGRPLPAHAPASPPATVPDAPVPPDGHQAEYDAFWEAGYTVDDLQALNELWHSESAESKARAGQLLLDGEVLPVAPGSTSPQAP